MTGLIAGEVGVVEQFERPIRTRARRSGAAVRPPVASRGSGGVVDSPGSIVCREAPASRRDASSAEGRPAGGMAASGRKEHGRDEHFGSRPVQDPVRSTCNARKSPSRGVPVFICARPVASFTLPDGSSPRSGSVWETPLEMRGAYLESCCSVPAWACGWRSRPPGTTSRTPSRQSNSSSTSPRTGPRPLTSGRPGLDDPTWARRGFTVSAVSGRPGRGADVGRA